MEAKQKEIKLYYFNTTGRAEMIRLCFVIGGIKFEDIRLTYDEYNKKYESGFFKFGQVPIIEIDGKQFAQSHAIAIWAAK